jgi:hypothetical protein
MTQNYFSPAPIQPLTAGNVVTASFRLYRDYFSTYFKISLEAALWGLVPFFAILPVPFLILSGQLEVSILWLVIPLWLILLFYASAKFMATAALIVRLAFGTLSDRPEALQEIRPLLKRKTWTFLWTSILTGGMVIALGLLVVGIIGLIVVGIIGGVKVGVLVGAGLKDSVAAYAIYVILGLLVIVALFFALVFLIRCMLRFTLPDIPLAIEENLTATQAIRRSWILTQGNVSQIFEILFVANFMTLPLEIIANFGSSFIQSFLLMIIPSEQSPIFISFYLIFNCILALAIWIILLPFWQAVKATIYYDLRSRKERINLQVRQT